MSGLDRRLSGTNAGRENGCKMTGGVSFTGTSFDNKKIAAKWRLDLCERVIGGGGGGLGGALGVQRLGEKGNS